jgi:hypothetical protein
MGSWHLEAFIRKSWPEKIINQFLYSNCTEKYSGRTL